MEYPRITSRRNPLAKAAAALAGSARERRERRRFLCEGARLCRDAAESGIRLEACFFTAQAMEKYPEYLKAVLTRSKEAYEISQEVAQLLSATKTPQGVFCVCESPASRWENVTGLAPEGPCIVLEDIQDPGNLGTILRTAEALGRFQVFLLGNCCDPLSPKALRASMGAVFRLELSLESSPERLLTLLHGRGYQTHGAVPRESARKVTEVDFSKGLHSIFIGNEGSGLRPGTAAGCGDCVTIPMRGRAESLNAAAAATVLIWELARGERSHGG